MDNRLANTLQIVDQVKPQFEQLAKIHNAVTWLEECSFAKRALQENDYLASIAASNPDSLKYAILDAATTGISLNPNKQHAALIPRKIRGKMKVCFEPMWRGIVQQAIDIGAIRWCAPELVYSNDQFEYQGFTQTPKHKFDPFGDRGHILGGYCVTCLADGSLLVTHMAINEIHKIRESTESWKAYKDKGSPTPWVIHHDEMCKKTLIKRARKNWPMKRDDRATNLDVIETENEPILLQPTPESDDAERTQLYLDIRTALDILERSEAKYCVYLKRLHGRDVKVLEDLTTMELKKSLADLRQMVDQKTGEENEKSRGDK